MLGAYRAEAGDTLDICALPEVDKRLLAKKVGSDLVRQHGKRSHYTVPEIKAAARRQKFPDTWDCWALSLYASAEDFGSYHLRTGEQCDYLAMRNSMSECVATDLSLADAIPADHSDLVAAVLDWSPSNSTSWFDNLVDFFSNVDTGFDFDSHH